MLSTSIDNTIAKIIRDTRVVDSSYLADMYEWIPEAMRLMKTMVEMPVTGEEIVIDNYKGHLPCGLIDFIAVEYQGSRLRYYTGIRPGSTTPLFVDDSSTGFTAYPTFSNMPAGDVLDIQYVANLSPHPSAGYQLSMDWITTNFKQGVVKVYFRKAPTDKKGLPLIPDHPDYKEAIYWWVRAKMIQAGYLDQVYGRDDRIPTERWELYAARAISDITYPTPDQKEAQLAMSVRFIPPTDYWSSFFNTEDNEPIYGGATNTIGNLFASPVGPLANSQGQ